MSRNKNRCFTLVELLVVMAIISILAGMLLPALEKAMSSARTTTCLGNQKQIGVTVHVYAGDWGGSLPPFYSAASWQPAYISEILAASGLGPSSDPVYYHNNSYAELKKTIFSACPEVGSAKAIAREHHSIGDYGFNAGHVTWAMDKTLKIEQFRRPSAAMLCIDAATVSVSKTSWYAYCAVCRPLDNNRQDARHNDGCVLLFIDGRASWKGESAIVANQDDLWDHDNPTRSGFGPTG